MRPKSRVSLVRCEERKTGIRDCLALIRADIESRLSDTLGRGGKLIVKPNLLSASRQLPSTEVQAVEAVLEFFQGLGVAHFLVAESSTGGTTRAFEHLNYHRLTETYNLRLVDLDRDDDFTETRLPSTGGATRVRVSNLLMDPSNFLVSLAKAKTHDTVVATLSVKNVLMGSIQRGDKMKMHRGIAEINQYLAHLAEHVYPYLAVVDGFVGMEGNGPSGGTPVDSRFAVASTDPLAADYVSLQCMGIEPGDVGYLNLLAESGLGNYDDRGVEVLGSRVAECRTSFKLHSNFRAQLAWKRT